jgi:glutamyl-tRNA synthetase
VTSVDRPVRVRIAPSPTGDPHVGTAYIALFNYAFARQQRGAFVLRIEDTDQSRARADSERMIYEALRWIGLTWDEGPDVGGPYAPYRQSERGEHYKDHAGVLLDAGKAYRCFCTEDRLAKLRLAQQAAKAPLGYDRHCRDIDPHEATRRAAAGEPHVVRLKVPLEGPIVFEDRLRGAITRDAKEIDDQVLLKSDGMPTYHLANVVDDHLMQITHVIRAEEWLSSTQKHVLLYRAFDWQAPEFIHMPLLRNADKSKISKRKNPVSINYYRDIGILPRALLNFLGTLGWSMGGDREKFTLDEMIAAFSWDRVSLGGPVFDLDKLRALNQRYIHELDYDALADALVAWRLNRDYLAKLMPLVRERVQKLDEVVPLVEFFFTGDLDYAPVVAEMVVPGVANADVKKALLALVEKLEAREGWTREVLDDEVTKWYQELGWTKGQALTLLRLAITARPHSPPLFETIAAIGKEIARRRLRRAADAVGANKAK